MSKVAVPRIEVLGSDEKITVAISGLRQELKKSRRNGSSSILDFKKHLDTTIASIQVNALLDAAQQIELRDQKEISSGQRTTFDERDCIAEILGISLRMTVKRVVEEVSVHYQLLLPYAAGFEDEDVKACYKVAFGTDTPSELSPVVSDRDIANALIAVMENVVKKGKFTPGSALLYIAQEVLKATIGASSPEAKGVICVLQLPATFWPLV